MGTSASSARGKPTSSPSASAVVPATSTGRHVFELRRYSMIRDTAPTGKAVSSLSFKIGGHSWHVDCYPNGYGPEQADSVSLVLILEQDRVSNEPVTADFTFALAGDQRDLIFEKEVFEFVGGNNWGTMRFIGKEELARSACLVDDCLTIICDVVVVGDLRTEKTEPVAVAALKPPLPRPLVVVPPSDIQRHLGDLLAGEVCTADATFVVRGETVTAHGCVLAARSPVFKAQLFDPMAEGETSNVIQIDDMEAAVFRALLGFVYTESLPWPTEKQHEVAMAQHLLVAADRYQMERLKLICEDKLCKHIDETSVVAALALADRHRCHGLKTACLQFLTASSKVLDAVMATEAFELLTTSCPSVVKELISELKLAASNG